MLAYVLSKFLACSLYDRLNVRPKLKNRITAKPVYVHKGIKQGYLASPDLFNNCVI